MRSPRRPLLTLTCLLAALLPAGCGKARVRVTGTVVRAQKPIPLGKKGRLQVTLVPVVEAGQGFTTLPARADPEGKFDLPGVPPGKYRVAVELFDPNPTVDKLRGAFSPKNTPITRDVDGKAPLVIDLAQPAS